MELRELAERILFGATLEDKLAAADEVTDLRPGSALAAPAMPGRPEALRFKDERQRGGGGPPPRVKESERERGRLLHFFANHELLATELMALVLLRFPEAPSAFRRDVLQTLRDEQEHTRLYLRRMQDCGVAFGEYPVSGYFWRSVAPMATPIDYVSGLSLTFEQANLDFCQHFARGFEQVGDVESARLLNGIYRDEIAHVAYGLKWFRRWKDPGVRDWDAFCRALRFPLSPQRAKGIGWNAEGRRAAGLDAEFIRHLEVYSASKGRTPDVFWFNPFCEGVLAGGQSFTPGREQAQLAQDLALLPQYLGQRDDVVVVPKQPGTEHLVRLQNAGFPVLEWVVTESRTRAELSRDVAIALKGRKLGRLRPWAWGPDSIQVLGGLRAASMGGGPRESHALPAEWERLYSKAWSAAWLRKLLTGPGAMPALEGPGPSDWLCRDEDVGREARSEAEALEWVAEIRARGHHRVVIKESLGLAGGNASRWWEPEPTLPQRRWLERAFEGGRTVVVEPWLDRVLDISVQWEMRDRKLRLVGYAGLETDASGRYLGNTFSPGWERRVPLHGGAGWIQGAPEAVAKSLGVRVPRWYSAIQTRLEEELCAAGFEGPLGIDAFAFRDQAGCVRWKPVVEVNPRCTMGRVALALAARVAPGRHGVLRLVRASQVRRLGFKGFAEWASARMARFPVKRVGEPVGRMESGEIVLTDPEQACGVVAVLRVAKEYAELWGINGGAGEGGGAERAEPAS